jgi:glycerophosphoryl diester phosphodiesterase
MAISAIPMPAAGQVMGSVMTLNPLPEARHRFTVVAHRGDHIQAPENTLAAYKNAIADGADYVEIDLRTTADSQLVILHDATVDRMTDGHGFVKEIRYKDLRKLRVRDWAHPEWGLFDVPSFREVLKLCRGRIHIYLDFKDADPAVAYREIVAAGMERQTVVYINSPQQLAGWRRCAPSMPVMVSMPDSIRDVMAMKNFLNLVHPEVLDGGNAQYTAEMVQEARRMGYIVIPDIQGPDESQVLWSGAIQKRIDGLQTDHPAMLIAWLREKGLR